MMQTGLGTLALTPSQFWRMTPRELALAIEGRFGPIRAPMERHDLVRLMARFPDEGDQNG